MRHTTSKGANTLFRVHLYWILGYKFAPLPPPPPKKKKYSLRRIMYVYTERQKKLITSSERHSLKSTASKCIIFGPRLVKVILNKHIKKIKFHFRQKGDKCGESARGKFSKITETARLPGWEYEADKSRYGGYITRHWNLINCYCMFWIGCFRGTHWESSFCDFRKITFRDFTAFFSFLTQANFFLLQMFLLGVLKLICVQIWLILMGWILVRVALRKW